VEEAVRMVEADGGEAVVLTLGPPEAEEQLRDCMAIGADRGILLKTDGREWDPQATAAAIADAAREHGPFDLVLESIGADSLNESLALLAPGGTCVCFGTSAGPEVTFNAQRFFGTGGATLYGFSLFYELTRRPAGPSLARLAQLVADNRLRPHVDAEAPWTEIAGRAQQLIDRQAVGKIVLHVAG
jgi:NADPH:quinone reductase-like Zn-dependent oxidoreductase